MKAKTGQEFHKGAELVAKATEESRSNSLFSKRRSNKMQKGAKKKSPN